LVFVAISSTAFDRIRAVVAAVQNERRLPSLVVAVAQSGRLLHPVSIGYADVASGLRAGPDVQYRIGSITKTVTAMAVMQLVAEGKLDLRGPLKQGWPGAPHDDISLADLLTHGSGLQREPNGSVWETLRFPARNELAATANEVQRLYPQDSWFHYSNLGFALLGEMVAQMSGTTWESWVHEHLLQPLEMVRTTPLPDQPSAQGYSVKPYTDEVVAEPVVDCRGLAAAGQLWSTAQDMCRWSGALSGSRPDLLNANTLAEMSAPRTMEDLQHWTRGFGLGLMLMRDGDTVYVGHTGSMPGFLAAVFCHPSTQLAVVVLTNTSSGLPVGPLAVQLLGLAREGFLAESERVSGAAPPERITPLLGRWWSEWHEWVFRWRDGKLLASEAEKPPGDAPTEFAEIAEDIFVALNGTERGERLLVVRGVGEDPIAVKKLYWATYPFTRAPESIVGSE
jgi:CubicO group peptidase (beta-lactamase class C family)